MREILFRGQTRRYGEKVRIGDGAKMPSHWVYGGVLQGAGSHSVIYGGENVDDISEGLNKHVVYTDTLGQYTGRTDLYDKKIFEGDIVIVELEDSTGEKWRETKKVHYNSDECCWYPMRWEEECDLCEGWTEIKSIEVIGNKYDNPELLEVSDGN